MRIVQLMKGKAEHNGRYYTIRSLVLIEAPFLVANEIAKALKKATT